MLVVLLVFSGLWAVFWSKLIFSRITAGLKLYSGLGGPEWPQLLVRGANRLNALNDIFCGCQIKVQVWNFLLFLLLGTDTAGSPAFWVWLKSFLNDRARTTHALNFVEGQGMHLCRYTLLNVKFHIIIGKFLSQQSLLEIVVGPKHINFWVWFIDSSSKKGVLKWMEVMINRID